jgi:tRNA modification GTPase
LRTAAILIDQAQGALDKALRTIVEQLGQQRTTAAKQGLVALLAHRRVGLHLVHPWRVALNGPPNVGKSSLINALVGYQRAIVYEQPGTTRDVVRAAAAFDGWPMQLLDTAGLRDSHDAVETEGIRRARQTARDADLVLLIQDAAQPMASDQHPPLVTDASRLIHIRNKIDLVNSQAADIGMVGCLATSALSGQGIPELMAAIVQRLVGPPPAAGAAVPFTRQQVASLQQALDSCERRQPATAVAALWPLMSHSIAPAGV